VKIILDPGSCHMGKLEKALELVRLGASVGADAVKFQLLTTKQTEGTGNINLEWDFLPELMDVGERYGIEVFASVFNIDGIRWLTKCGAQSVKFSYGMSGMLHDPKVKEAIKGFPDAYVSLDTSKLMPPMVNLISLYCVPEYPVRYKLDF